MNETTGGRKREERRARLVASFRSCSQKRLLMRMMRTTKYQKTRRMQEERGRGRKNKKNKRKELPWITLITEHRATKSHQLSHCCSWRRRKGRLSYSIELWLCPFCFFLRFTLFLRALLSPCLYLFSFFFFPPSFGPGTFFGMKGTCIT